MFYVIKFFDFSHCVMVCFTAISEKKKNICNIPRKQIVQISKEPITPSPVKIFYFDSRDLCSSGSPLGSWPVLPSLIC